MAPEQSGGKVDRRADIYALGAVLYEMLTGERPEKNLMAPSSKVQFDVKIDEMVLRALEKEPELRYQTAGEFRTVVQTMVGEMSSNGNIQANSESKADKGTVRTKVTTALKGRWKLVFAFTWVMLAGIAGPGLIKDYLVRRAGAPISESLARQAITPYLEAESLRWNTMRFEPNTKAPSDVLVRFDGLEATGQDLGSIYHKPVDGFLYLKTLDGNLWRATGMEGLAHLQFTFALSEPSKTELDTNEVASLAGDHSVPAGSHTTTTATSKHVGMTPTLALPIAALLILVGIILVVVLAVRKRKAGGNAGKVVAIGCGVLILAPVIIVGLVAVFIRWMSPVGVRPVMPPAVEEMTKEFIVGGFEPVVERELLANDLLSSSFLDVETGRVLSAPKELVESLKSIRPMGKSLPQVELIADSVGANGVDFMIRPGNQG